jgi:hypothetical protein
MAVRIVAQNYVNTFDNSAITGEIEVQNQLDVRR